MIEESIRHGLQSTQSIELLIFDCDGVLVDSELICVDVLLGKLHAIGVNVDSDYFNRHFLGRSFEHVTRKVHDYFNVVLPPDFETQYQHSLLRAFAARLKATDGIRLVIEQLAIPYCVATSSSPKRTKKALELTGLNDLFTDNVFTASQVKIGKPAPDLFLFAAQQMGVKPECCLVIEDSFAGLHAAQAANMLVWQYVGGSHMTLEQEGSAHNHLCNQQELSITRFSSWQNFYNMAANLKQTS